MANVSGVPAENVPIARTDVIDPNTTAEATGKIVRIVFTFPPFAI